MTQQETTPLIINPLRLRIGVLLILLWWLPFWALSPYIASAFGSSDDTHLTGIITTVIIIIQTLLGIAGMYLCGKQTAAIIKQTPKKQVPAKIWHILLHGTAA